MFKNENLISVEEVITSFLITEKAKSIDMSKKTNSQFIEIFTKIKQEIESLPIENKYALMPTKDRLNFYLKHNWVLKEVPLKYIGPWGSTGDIPVEWCSLSVIDVASRIKNNKEYTSKSIQEIINMTQDIDLILKQYPPILVQGGEIRAASDTQFLSLDSEDGSHRCIAAALKGLSTVRSFVGFP